MKKILSLILTAAMLLSAVVMTAGAEDLGIGFGEYMPNAFNGSEADMTQALDAEQKDAQGIYYTLDDETMTAIVGKNTYADSASAGEPNTDSVIIPATVTVGDKSYTVTAVGRNAFDGTAIREIFIPCETIGEFAFAGCTELEQVYTVASDIKGFAFWGCTSLTEVYCFVADTIGGGAFWNCSNLQNVTLAASTIMEKAFEGCDSIEYFVFGGDAPEVAAGALGTTAKAYIAEGAAGYEDFPLTTEILKTPIIDVENVYAKAGETVEVSVVVPVGAVPVGVVSSASDIEIALDVAEGLTVTNVISGEYSLCCMENATLDTGKITGTVEYSMPGILVILEVKVSDNAVAGAYAITATADGYTSIAGSVTICDHADTKTVTTKSASCTEAGSADTVCVACGEVISSADVEAKDHAYKDVVIAPTCTKGGYTRHICEVCADSYTDTETEATDHTWNDGEVTVEASTSKEGLMKYTCLTCGSSKDVTIPKIKYGDANVDGDINLADVTIILKKIANWNLSAVTFSETNANVNVDENINLGDVTLILKYIANWDGIVLGPAKD